mmetsp:Transcript_19745/g.40266  ORF Transcript_19745/g.40266 Transcript_19745/m.40266 type:complete len:161 (+) Transcript_19745:62-544(+)
MSLDSSMPSQPTMDEATAAEGADCLQHGGATVAVAQVIGSQLPLELSAQRSKRLLSTGEQPPGPNRNAQSLKKPKMELTPREQAQLRILAGVPGLQQPRDATGRRKAVSVDLSAHLSELVSGELSGAAHDTRLSPRADGSSEPPSSCRTPAPPELARQQH